MRNLLTSLAGFMSWHRRTVAAVLAAGAVLLFAAALRAPEPGRPVVVLAADLPAGHTLTHADITVVELPPVSVPVDPLTAPLEVVGRSVAIALSAGTVLQPGMLSGDLTAADGRAIVPISVADDSLRTLLRAGDVVSLVAPGPEGLEVLSTGARIVATPVQGEGAGSRITLASGRPSEILLVDVPTAEAGIVASLGQAGEISIVLGTIQG